MLDLIYIALGGVAGTLLRYIFCYMLFVSAFFPWSTLFVNVSGSCLIGFFYCYFKSGAASAVVQKILLIGFLGAFTTFSTFSLECINLFIDGRLKAAFLYILLSNIFSIGGAFLGFSLAKIFLGRV
jgi:fluoride exporter